MLKRKNPYAPEVFSCPGCEEMFDAEARAPFVGSCGHSLCSTCVNEKKTKTCPVCNKRGGFATTHKSLLAIELLAALTKAHESMIPAILKPEFLSFLPQVVNHLDPRSFARLARTCKPIHDLCFNSKEIKIIYEIPRIRIMKHWEDLVFDISGKYGNALPLDYAGNDHGFLDSVENRKKLKNYPFVFNLKYLDVMDCKLDDNSFAEFRSFLAEFGIKSISEIEIERPDAWNGFVQFLKDIPTKDVYIESGVPFDIPEDAAAYLFNNIPRFGTDMLIPDRLILTASTPCLFLKYADISKETFVTLLKRFGHSTEELRWEIGCQDFKFGHYDVFKLRNPSHNEEKDGPEELPLVEVDDCKRPTFWVWRPDGSRMRCSKYINMVSFSTEKFNFEHYCSSYTDSDEESDDGSLSDLSDD